MPYIFLIVGFLSAQNVFAQMEFVQNKGQWDERIQFKGDFKTGAFFLEKKGFTVMMHNEADLLKRSKYFHDKRKKNKEVKETDLLHSHAYNVQFLGANDNAFITPDKAIPTYNNYFIGNNKAKWAADCKIFNAITYKNIYPNIDIRYYSTQGQLKYDFIVHPGGNPASIALRYDGVDKLSVKNNELIIGTSLGDLRELSPYSYQSNTSERKDVNTKYVVKDNVVTFNVANYDPTSTLVIDPQLIFVSFTGSTQDNFGFTATPGIDGSFYSGGIVFGAGFLVTLGAFQTPFGGGTFDIGIFKFSSNGTQRLYATYIGGNGDEQPHSMIADALGNLVIAGRTNSPNYPLLTSIPATGNGNDIVVTKLNATGTALIGSVKIGGSGDDGLNAGVLDRNYGDDAKSEVILDANNNVILASTTASNNFPLQTPLQPTYGGGDQDGVIIKFNPTLSNLIFSTYYGGTGDDACIVTTINPITNNIYVGGGTSSNNLLGNTTGTINPTPLGGIDGFVTQLLPDGSAFVNTTYIGTTGEDVIYGLKFDRFGFPYIMGTTTGVWLPFNATFSQPNSKQFIAKLQPNLSAFIYSTNFGTNATEPNLSPTAFLVDRCENVYVSGWGGSTNAGFPNSGTNGLTEVNQIPLLPAADGSDFYFFVLKKNAEAQLFGSHFGQNGGTGDHVDGGTSRFDENGVIYQAMCANCGDANSISFPTFPTTGPNLPWSPINRSSNCNLAAVKIEMDFSGIANVIQSSIAGVLNDTFACNNILVTFKDTLQKGVKYFWNFDFINFPNNTDTITLGATSYHYYTAVGRYRVRLISEDSSTCNIRDTAYIDIEISDKVLTPKFRIDRLEPCSTNLYQFTNLSIPSLPTTFTPKSFVWDYGDGSPKDTTNFSPVRTHTYASTGTYQVILTAIDNRFCNTPASDTQQVVVLPNVQAKTNPITFGCGQTAQTFENLSLLGITYKWEIVTPNNTIVATSTDFTPIFAPLPEGNYKYRLIAFNPNTCNKSDTTAYFNFTVLAQPTALFDFTPRPSQPNTPTTFINLSTNADRYLWDFGDGQTSAQVNPVHEYDKKGKYKVVLVAYNKNCTDTARLDVDVLINQLLDVPNAFTPGKFGQNGIVFVRGFGIGKMVWRIYNRWGELVFKSTDKRSGWDGYYKGKLQPTDVYAYTLDVEFDDGEKVRKTGDITLLR
jgi:gliding motility-associated-like protein